MAQLSTSMRSKRSAITSIHDTLPTRREKLVNVGGWVLLVVAVVMLAVGIYGIYRVMTDAKVAELEVVGMGSELEQQQLLTHIAPIMQHNYFTSDLRAIRDQTLELSWVDRVVVSRAWPNAIKLRVMPRHPIARWGTGRLLSDSGDVFSPVSVGNTESLPLMYGPPTHSKMMMRRYHEINELFLPVNLRLKELYLTERMTWFMTFDNDLRVIVDKDQTMSKLQRLSHLAQSDLQPVWGRISALDLRYWNGLAIQWKNSTAPRIVNGHFATMMSNVNAKEEVKAKP